MRSRNLMIPILLLWLGSPQVLAAPPEISTARDLGERFYGAYLSLKVSGLPTGSQMKTLGPYLSAELLGLIEKARKEQTQFIKDHPDEKPPWIEGDLFSSSFEGFTSFKIAEPKEQGGSVEVPVQLQYLQGKDDVKWTDSLILARVGNEWKVADILMKGKWKFKSGESLRQILGATQGDAKKIPAK